MSIIRFDPFRDPLRNDNDHGAAIMVTAISIPIAVRSAGP